MWLISLIKSSPCSSDEIYSRELILSIILTDSSIYHTLRVSQNTFAIDLCIRDSVRNFVLVGLSRHHYALDSEHFRSKIFEMSAVCIILTDGSLI